MDRFSIIHRINRSTQDPYRLRQRQSIDNPIFFSNDKHIFS